MAQLYPGLGLLLSALTVCWNHLGKLGATPDQLNKKLWGESQASELLKIPRQFQWVAQGESWPALFIRLAFVA